MPHAYNKPVLLGLEKSPSNPNHKLSRLQKKGMKHLKLNENFGRFTESNVITSRPSRKLKLKFPSMGRQLSCGLACSNC